MAVAAPHQEQQETSIAELTEQVLLLQLTQIILVDGIT